MSALSSAQRRSVILCGMLTRLLVVSLVAVAADAVLPVAVTSLVPLVVPYALYETLGIAWASASSGPTRRVVVFVILGGLAALVYWYRLPALLGVGLAVVFSVLFDVVRVDPRIEWLLDRTPMGTGASTPFERDDDDRSVATLTYYPTDDSTRSTASDESNADANVCPDCGLALTEYLVGEFCPQCGRPVDDSSRPPRIR